MSDSVTTDSIVLDCINKGYDVTFKLWPASKVISCCVEREGQFPGAKMFTDGRSLMDAAINAARHAHVPGY